MNIQEKFSSSFNKLLYLIVKNNNIIAAPRQLRFTTKIVLILLSFCLSNHLFAVKDIQTLTTNGPSFVAFESGPVRPIAISPNGKRLFVTNISDNRLEIFDITGRTPRALGSVLVGLEPVAVTALNNKYVYVANHLSDSVSVVDVSIPSRSRVVKTLLVGDEPRDLVITDPDGNGPLSPRLFVTTAHRGQHRTHPSIADVPGAGDPQFNTPGIGRADVWVFNTHNLGKTLGAKPIKIMSFFADTPRALAVSNDGSKVYVASHFSQNRTAVVSEFVVCDGFDQAPPCETYDGKASPGGLVNAQGKGMLPGGIPGPAANVEGFAAPETSLIIRFDPNAGPVDDDVNTGQFLDELGRNWTNGVRMRLPDKDVFAIDALTLQEIAFHQTIGTTLFNMAVNPKSGVLYVSNTDAQNFTRFEGDGTAHSTVQGHLAESRISIITDPDTHKPDGSNIKRRHLNPHIDYTQLKAPLSVKEKSLATPLEMVISPLGETLYVAAFGSQAIGVFKTKELESGTFTPDTQSKIHLSAGGPGGLVMTKDGSTLYAYTRFDNGISVIDTHKQKEIEHIQMFNPEPTYITQGRPFLYDARISSSNGEASCASCHIFGDNDYLAWDLGVPEGQISNSSIPTTLQEYSELLVLIDGPSNPDVVKNFEATNGDAGINQFHPMKGAMGTQTLRGINTHGSMHWRGDRVSGLFTPDPENPTDTDAFDENLSFINFAPAFESLNGKYNSLPLAQMQLFSNFMCSVFLPPNPVRNIDNQLTPSQQRGRDFYFGPEEDVTLPDGSTITVKRRLFFLSEAQNIQFNQTHGVDVVAGFTCEGCHRLDPEQGFFGTDGNQSFEGAAQIFKVPHLRNLVNKVGFFGTPPHLGANQDTVPDPKVFDFQGDQIKAYGYLHDGATDTVFNFMSNLFFLDTGKGTGFKNTQQRHDMTDFLFAFPTDLAPIVGQQMTIRKMTSPGVDRVKLMLKRSDTIFTSHQLGGQTREADVVVKCISKGKQYGFLHLGDNKFKSDRGRKLQNLNSLIKFCKGPATFTAVPSGSGYRIGIDRDLDGLLDGWE